MGAKMHDALVNTEGALSGTPGLGTWRIGARAHCRRAVGATPVGLVAYCAFYLNPVMKMLIRHRVAGALQGSGPATGGAASAPACRPTAPLLCSRWEAITNAYSTSTQPNQEK